MKELRKEIRLFIAELFLSFAYKVSPENSEVKKYIILYFTLKEE